VKGERESVTDVESSNAPPVSGKDDENAVASLEKVAGTNGYGRYGLRSLLKIDTDILERFVPMGQPFHLEKPWWDGSGNNQKAHRGDKGFMVDTMLDYLLWGSLDTTVSPSSSLVHSEISRTLI
ncbi:hypothetical protein NQZ68_026564, partial [Dissostichus eleginoides]